MRVIVQGGVKRMRIGRKRRARDYGAEKFLGWIEKVGMEMGEGMQLRCGEISGLGRGGWGAK